MTPLAMHVIYLVYGLSFLAMGLVIHLRTQPIHTLPLARAFQWLAGFGFSHGALEMAQMLRHTETHLAPDQLLVLHHVALALSPLSFSLLLQFAVELANVTVPRLLPPWSRFVPVGLMTVWLAAYPWGTNETHGWLVMAEHYGLATPSALLAALALLGTRQLPHQQEVAVSYLPWAGWGFAVYTLLALVTPETREVPLVLLSEERFLALFGAPVQLFRATTAAFIAFAIGRALHLFIVLEREQLTATVAIQHQQLRQSEEKYHNLFQHSLDAIFIAEADTGRVVDANEAACHLLGRSCQELIGLHQSQLYPPEEADHFRAQFQRVVAAGHDFVPHARIIRADGARVPVDISAACFPGDQRVLVQGIFRDMTQQRQVEASLREQSGYLDSILRSSTKFAIAATDAQYVVRYFNPAAERLFEVTAAEVIGQSVPDIHLLRNVEAFRFERAIAIVRAEGIYRYQVKRQVAGEMRVTDSQVTGIWNQEGELTGFVLISEEITERLRAEEELRQHRDHLDDLVRRRTQELESAWQKLDDQQLQLHHYASIVAASPDHLALLDRHYVYLAVNDTYLAYHQQERTAIVGHCVAELLGEETFTQVVRPRFDDCLNGKEVRYQNWFVFPAYGRRWMDVSYAPFRDEEGAVTGLVVVSRDMTERKLAEESLAESERRFGLFMEHLPGVAFMKDNQYRMLYVNKGFEVTTGLPLADVVGRDNRELWPVEVASQLDGNDRLVFVTGQPQHFIEAIPAADGMHYWLAHKFPLPDREGELSLLGGVSVDITEQLLAERNIRDMARFPNENPNPVVRVNREGRILYANRGSQPLLELWNRRVGEHLNREWRGNIAKALASGQTERIEVLLHNHTIALVLVPQPESDDVNIYGADITDLKQLLALLKQRQGEVEELNARLELRVREEVEKNRQKDSIMMHQSRLAAMGEMIGNIAHQWRQPINALNLLLHNLWDAHSFGELTPAFLSQQVDLGERIIQQMSATIDDFRHFFRPDKTRQTFDVAQAVADALSLMHASLANQRTETRILHPDHPVLIQGFPNEFVQVILLLINNAKDAIQERKVMHGRILLSVQELADQVVVSVQDNGGGIAGEIIEQIFDPYFTTKAAKQGTGIGLYMAKIIIEKHMMGRIEASNREQGAEFRILLPR